MREWRERRYLGLSISLMIVVPQFVKRERRELSREREREKLKKERGESERECGN